MPTPWGKNLNPNCYGDWHCCVVLFQRRMTDFSKAISSDSFVSNSSLGQYLKLAWEWCFQTQLCALWWFFNSSHVENHYKCMHFSHAEAAFYTPGDYSGGRWLVKDMQSREERHFNNIFILIWSQHVALIYIYFGPQSILAMNIFWCAKK